MKNLNKFTKAELINKYTKLENQNSNQTQTQSKYQLILNIIDKILLFKSLILKITLIGFLIKWIRKYSLVRKFWHIFAIIGNTLLGISIIDIYSWDIISWIKDLSVYKWYSELFSTPDINSNRKEDIPSRMSEINQNSNENQTNSQRNSRIIEWINRDSEKTKVDDLEILTQQEFNELEDSNKYNYKNYFIIGSVIILSCLSWYYWDTLKSEGVSILEWIKSFRSGGNDDSTPTNINNPSNINNPILRSWRSSVEDIKSKDISTIKSALRDKFYKTIEVDNVENVQATSSNVKIEDLNKAKSVLTSPSLENLNEQAKSSWSEGISSPDSDKTVTPASISESNASSSSASSSSSSSSLLNVSNFIQDNWRNRLSKEVNDKINFVENSFNNNEIDNNITDYFAYLVNEYNTEIGVYNFMKNNPSRYSIENINALKESIYYFREWISEYQSKIFPISSVTVEVGSIQDSPKILTKNIV